MFWGHKEMVRPLLY